MSAILSIRCSTCHQRLGPLKILGRVEVEKRIDRMTRKLDLRMGQPCHEVVHLAESTLHQHRFGGAGNGRAPYGEHRMMLGAAGGHRDRSLLGLRLRTEPLDHIERKERAIAGKAREPCRIWAACVQPVETRENTCERT